MAPGGDASRRPSEDEMLPDERDVIVERVDELDEESDHLALEEVAADLDIDVD